MSSPTIIDFITDPDALGPYYEGESWDRWRACLRAAYALPMDDADLALFREVAGDRAPPQSPVSEFVALVGRGGGKDAIAAAVAAHIASTSDFSRLRPGERGTVLVIAVDRAQAGIAFGYIKALFEQVPMLAALVERVTDDTVQLRNGAEIVVATNNYRSVRGKTLICVIFDEVAFWRSGDSASPDIEVDAAVGPGLARWRNAIKIMISSVYRRVGLAHERHRDCFGRDDPDTLVVLGTTQQFNPGFDEKVIERALARDFARASAEYLSKWRDDLSSFVDPEALAANIVVGRPFVPYDRTCIYRAFCDPSGGRSDAMTVAIAHRDNESRRIVLDNLLEIMPPFDPADAVPQVAQLLKSYGLNEVTGDAYGAEWVVTAFKAHGIEYVTTFRLPDGKRERRTRSEIYLSFLPLVNSGQTELLDHKRMRDQFCALERRVQRSGRDSVNHPEYGSTKHDDTCNAVAGAIVLVDLEPVGVSAVLVTNPGAFQDVLAMSRAMSTRGPDGGGRRADALNAGILAQLSGAKPGQFTVPRSWVPAWMHEVADEKGSEVTLPPTGSDE